jgi:DNA-binding HxlR family transcriptional regulator
VLLRKWSVPVLAELGRERRFSELAGALQGITARALAIALKDLEAAGLVRRDVRTTRPPSTLYSLTAAGERARRALDGPSQPEN